MNRSVRVTVALACFLVNGRIAMAEDLGSDDLWEMPLQELVKIKVISATKEEQFLVQAPATVRVVTAQQIKTRGYLTLYDALRDLPGIDILNVQGAFPQLYAFRGGFGDENRRLLLLVDGVEETSINGSFEFAGPAFALDQVDRIEVIWGPASALYGANAFSGIINIITKRNLGRQQVHYSKGTGSFDSQTDQFYLSYPFGSNAFFVSGSRMQTDGEVYRNRHPDFSDAYVDDAYHWSMNWRGSTEKLTWDLAARHFESPMGDGVFGSSPTAYFGLPSASAQNAGTAGWINFDVNGDPASRWSPYFQTTFAQADYQFNHQTSLQLEVAFRENGLNDDTYSILQRGENFYKFHGAFESTQEFYHLQLTHRFPGSETLHIGSDYSDSDMEEGYRRNVVNTDITVVDGIPIQNWNSDFAPRRGVNVYNHSIYFQYQFDAVENTRVTLGSRYDENSLYGQSFNPKLGVVSDLNEQITLKMLYGRAYRAPSVFEVFSASPVRQANPDLKPETVDTLELGVYSERERILLKTNLFYNKLDDVIVDGIQVGDGQTQIQNAGKANIFGGEIELDLLLDDRLHFMTNYSYQEAEQDNGEGYTHIGNAPRHKANVAFDWDIYQGYHLHLMNNWVGRRTTVETNPVDEVSSYVVSHIALQTPDYFNGQLNFNLRVNNIFDREYVDPGHRSANGIQYSTVSEQPGRAYWLQARITL